MQKLKFTVFVFLVGLFVCGTLSAQVTELVSQGSLNGPNTTQFGFQPFIGGAAAGDLLSAWGVMFPDQPNGIPTILAEQNPLSPVTDQVVRNDSPMDDSSATPLIINFAHPVRAVGFQMGNAGAEASATLTAFDRQGNELGSVASGAFTLDRFFGIQTTAPAGISKVVLDYGMATEDEEIDDLVIEFLNRPVFRTYLAQVGDGVFEELTFRTTIVISNLSSSTAQVTMNLFNDDGDPLVLDLDGNAASTFNANLQPFAAATFESQAPDGVVVGYACIDSNVPVEGTAIFQLFDTGNLFSEGGVGSGEGDFSAVAAVIKEQGNGLNSGLSLANTSGQAVDVNVTRINANGQTQGTTVVSLPAFGHRSRFVDELFEDLMNQDFQGSLIIRAEQPIAVAVLRTLNGRVFSSLPVGKIAD